MNEVFVWENEKVNTKELIKVELIITKAHSVHNDPFSMQDDLNYNLDIYLMTPDHNSKIFTKTVYLSPGMYHFLYKITTHNEAWLEMTRNKYKTVLGSGRSVNYIDVGAISPRSTNSYSDCIRGLDENSPLLSPKKKKQSQGATVVARKGWCCCTR